MLVKAGSAEAQKICKKSAIETIKFLPEIIL